MIIVLRAHATETDVQTISDLVCSLRYQPRIIRGVEQTVIACIGDEMSNRSLEVLKTLPAVESVFPVQRKFKLVSREYHPEDSCVKVKNTRIGDGNIAVIAGPCAIESYEQFRTAVSDMVDNGIELIRAMPFKPRTSPYDFQGLKLDGAKIMRDIKKEFDVAYVSEVPGAAQIEILNDITDMFQVGARNAQNYDLLEQVAKAGKPVLLKRGMASTIEEWLTAAEYLVVNGCLNVVLCERGLRSFDKATRNLLDIGAVAVAKQLTYLPVVVDPSHAAGTRSLVPPLARAAIAAGADGLIVEAHPDPVNAFSDATQQLMSSEFNEFLADIQPWIDLAGSAKRSGKSVEPS